MARARGANAVQNVIFESTYGTTPGASGWKRLPFVSSQLGEERGLIASDLLGQGREMQDPTLDVANNAGDLTLPVDARAFGYWLKLMLGAPTTTGTAASATGVLTGSANYADAETVTIDGKVYTFQATLTEADGHVHVGANLAASITNLFNAINGTGGTAGTDYAAATVAHQRVTASASTSTTLTVAARVGGPAGALITTTETAANATWGGATLAGGSCATHAFSSGAATLPSMSIEIGNPDVPAFSTHFGARANTLKVSLQRQGLLNAVLGLVAQGESSPLTTSAAGTPTVITAMRFAQGAGQILRDGAVLGSIVSAEFAISNNLDIVETIRSDGRIEDADPAMFAATGALVTRFKDLTLYNLAVNNTPVTLVYSWTLGDFTLTFTFARVFLPRVKRPVTGPAGIQASFNWQGSGPSAPACTVQLVTDVASY